MSIEMITREMKESIMFLYMESLKIDRQVKAMSLKGGT